MSQTFSSSRSGPTFPSRSHGLSAMSEGSYASAVRRRPLLCRCHEVAVVRTVTDLASVNRGKKFWGCRNYKDSEEKGCNFFLWVDDEIVDERDLKIARKKRKTGKRKDEICLLKEELCTTRKWLKTSILCGCVSVGINLVLVTMMFSTGRAIENSSMFLN